MGGPGTLGNLLTGWALGASLKKCETEPCRTDLGRGNPTLKDETMTALAPDFQVIDADTHYTEPYDLWTSRAPKDLVDQVLHVEKVNGVDTWFASGN